MLEKVGLDAKLPKSDYKKRKPALQNRLLRVQRACWHQGLGSLIVFEGWNSAGRVAGIGKLTERLEPRGFELHEIREPRSTELALPWLWRFWQRLPNYGQMAIFDRSWYQRVMAERVDKAVAKSTWRGAYRDIVAFEQTLAQDHYVLIKLFFHITKKEQAKRLKAREKHAIHSWRVGPRDWEHHRKYDLFHEAAEEMLERTTTEWGPWALISAMDHRWARIKLLETVLEGLESGLRRRGLEVPELEPEEQQALEDADSAPPEEP